MTHHIPTLCGARTRRQSGFTLLNVLIAAVLFGLGILGIVRSFVAVTSAATQNENVSTIASLANGFQGVVQANSGLLLAAGFNGTGTSYTSANYTTAPLALQPWLKLVTTPATGLPGAIATVSTGPNSATGAACTQFSGCTVTLQLQWTQVGAPGSASNLSRSQTFTYDFGKP